MFTGYPIHQGGQIVFRFLENLVAPYRALAHLTAHASVFANSIKVTLVRPAPPTADERKIPDARFDSVQVDLEKTVVAELRAESENAARADLEMQHAKIEAARSWIDLRFKKHKHIPFRGNVHAESAVMALSCVEFEPGHMV